jgi:hypothetical protein
MVKALSFLYIVRITHIYQSGSRFRKKPGKSSCKRRRISEFVVDKTIIQVGS